MPAGQGSFLHHIKIENLFYPDVLLPLSLVAGKNDLSTRTGGVRGGPNPGAKPYIHGNVAALTDSDCFTDKTAVLSGPPWGTHACLVYRSRHDLIDTLVPYFQSGLEQDACCVWITADPLQAGAAKKVLARSVKDLDRRLRRGEVQIFDANEWYLRDGGFSCSAALNRCIRKGLEAQERGYEGLFISGNVSWLTGMEWGAFMEYEAKVNRAIGSSRIAAVCAYPLDACGTRELLEIASTHQLAVIRQDGEWRRITLGEENAPPDQEKRWAIGQIEANIEQFATLADRIRHPLQVLMALADLIENEHSDAIRQQAKEINEVVRQLDSGWAGSRAVREYLMNHDLAGAAPVTEPGTCPHLSGYPDSRRSS
ncbi:hypothetical protein DIC75_11685 [Methanoculleus sp. CWC-02]|uniref:MEDS domain-containing protein n=1 Tax=Methanoculleus oceani TaxID=2184756 RepID=A0ABD4TF14_9EURY|nr:hypothetical protein [Methanoculleus sp. CWC-02]